MPQRGSERRHHQRLHFEEPIDGEFGTVECEIVDLSLQGARILHVQALSTGRRAGLHFRWLDRPLTIDSEVVRCKFDRKAEHGGNLYVSGLRYPNPADEGSRLLKDIITEQVIRAVEEQIANARGTFIPLADRMTIFRSDDVLTLRAPSGQKHRLPSSARSFISCTWTGRSWRTVSTSETAQPQDGFTVSGLEDPKHVDLLCRTYEKSDDQTRRMIRMLAELSVRQEPLLIHP